MYEVFIENDRWKLYLQGLGNTIIIALCSFILAFGIAILIATLDYYRLRFKKFTILSKIVRVFVKIIMATPLLLFLMLSYYNILSFIDSAIIIAIIAFAINSAAYQSEIIRGGLESVSKGQVDAAKALGFSNFYTVTRIILPQALKNCLPSLINEFIMDFKLTSVVGYISIIDITQAANIVSTNTFNFLLPQLIATIIYIILVFSFTGVFKLIEKRLKKYD